MPATLIQTAGNQLAAVGNTITVTLAAGPSAGETLVAVVYHTDDFTATPSGWTKDREDPGLGVITVFSKVATGSEGTSYVFTAPTNGGMAARVMRYSGLSTLHAASGPATGSSPAFSAALTTSTAGTFLIGGYGLRATTLPLTDTTPSSGFAAVAADLKSTNGTGSKAQLQVVSGAAATATAYTYTGTFTPQSTSTAEVALVSYLQSTGDATVAGVRGAAAAAGGVPAVTGTAVGAVAAVRATATASAGVPVGGTITGATVTAVRATVAVAAQEPAVDVVVTLTGGGAAAGTAVARPPTVTGVAVSAVTAVVATGTGTGRAPVVTVIGTGGAAVNAFRATATATSNAPGADLAETLPSNVQTGRITARFAEAKVLIGDVDGIPNLYPYTTETVTFTSTARVLVDATATPAPVVIVPKPIVCGLDSQGYMVDSAGHQWCDLIATNDPDVTPAGRMWRVTLSSGLASATGITSFDIAVSSGVTKDLTADFPTA